LSTLSFKLLFRKICNKSVVEGNGESDEGTPHKIAFDQKAYRRINFMLDTISYTMDFVKESKVESYIY